MIAKTQKEEEEKKKASSVYANEVRQQIRDKEHERVAQRNAFFEEGVRLDEEARMRRQKLEEVKKRKLQELRLVPLPSDCSSPLHTIFFGQLSLIYSSLKYLKLWMAYWKLEAAGHALYCLPDQCDYTHV